MDDLISRQAAMDAVRNFGDCENGYSDTYDKAFIISALEELPSVQSERKKGKWIEDGYNDYKAVCSECGEPCGTYVMGKPRDNFCKWCGADMRKDGD